MFADLLTRKLRHIGPEAKFLLLALALHFRGRTPEPVSIEDLARQLMLPLRDVSKALAELVEVSLLTTHQDATRRGRPKRIFEINQACVKKYESAEGSITSGNLELARYAITAESIKAERVGSPSQGTRLDRKNKPDDGNGIGVVALNRAGNLSLANRLLLAVLLSRSDEFGVVSGLGSTELCALVGLKIPSLPQRLAKLVELGLIRRHVPGVASSIFSRKLKSIYILNLNHHQISRGRDSVSVFLHQDLKNSNDERRHLQRVWMDRRYLLEGNGTELPTHKSILDMLKSVPFHVFQQIEYSICRCVTEVLMSHWDLAQDRKELVKILGDFEFQDRFGSLFKYYYAKPRSKSSLPVQRFFLFLLGIIEDLTLESRRRFSGLGVLAMSGFSFMLVPSHLNSSHSSIALLVRWPSGVDIKSYWATDGEAHEGNVFELDRESDIALDVREASGLLTLVRAKAETK